MKRLVVHIGCAKGGSSAIQRGLRDNADSLAEQGIVVPSRDLLPESAVTGRHTEFFESFVEGRVATEIPRFDELLSVAAGEASTIVLSAENLSNPTEFEQEFAKLKGSFRVFVVLYVRRQDQFLASAWQQWNVKEGESLLAWVAKGVGVYGNWLRVIEPWADTFGDDHIVARVHDRDRLVGGDVFLDFVDVLGADATLLEVPGETNPSLNSTLSRLVEGRSFLFDGPHDGTFYASVRELAPDHVLKEAAHQPLFSAHEATEIVSRYQPSNMEFQRRYLPHIKGPLFAPVRSDDAAVAGPTNLDALERGFLQQQIFSLHKQVMELRRFAEGLQAELRNIAT